MRKLIRKLINDRQGNFALMTAFVAVPVVVAAGIAIDYSTALSKRGEMQNAADAAVLAAASSGYTDETKLRDIVNKVFAANTSGSLGVTPKVTDVVFGAENRILIRASATVPLTLGKMVRPNGIEVAVMAEAQRGSDDKIEVAMALDNTYSMTGQKLTDLKSAANALLTVFEKADTAKTKARFSIVPFARYVNVGVANKNQSWMDAPADITTTGAESCSKPIISQSGCTTVPVTSTSTIDGISVTTTSNKTTCTSTVYGDPVCKPGSTSTQTWKGCVLSRKNPLDTQDTEPTKKYGGLINYTCTNPITTLTNNYTVLRAAIKAMATSSGAGFSDTFISPGVLWGWNTLSPAEPFTDGLSYDADVQKFIILMTDGANTTATAATSTTAYFTHTLTPNAAATVTKADSLLSTTCANAKLKNITIFTVGVGVAATDSTAIALGKCASDPKKAILVQDSAKLVEVFEEIANQILVPRLTQ